jgi:hypothetical protein
MNILKLLIGIRKCEFDFILLCRKRESIEKHLAQNRIEHQIAQRESLLENEIKSSIQDIKQKYLSLFPSERDENKKHDILIPTEVQIFDEKRTKKPLEIKPHSIKDIYLKPEGRINSRSANTSGLMTRKSQSQTYFLFNHLISTVEAENWVHRVLAKLEQNLELKLILWEKKLQERRKQQNKTLEEAKKRIK